MAERREHVEEVILGFSAGVRSQPTGNEETLSDVG